MWINDWTQWLFSKENYFVWSTLFPIMW
jgi:hypothetical protein